MALLRAATGQANYAALGMKHAAYKWGIPIYADPKGAKTEKEPVGAISKDEDAL